MPITGFRFKFAIGGVKPPISLCTPIGTESEDAYEPGYWRSPWSDTVQADWLTQVMAIACSKPYVQSVCWQELADAAPNVPAPEMPHGGLLLPGGAPKPAFLKFAQFRQMMKEGKSPVSIRPQ